MQETDMTQVNQLNIQTIRLLCFCFICRISRSLCNLMWSSLAIENFRPYQYEFILGRQNTPTSNLYWFPEVVEHITWTMYTAECGPAKFWKSISWINVSRQWQELALCNNTFTVFLFYM
jgi:hypothetical protein